MPESEHTPVLDANANPCPPCGTLFQRRTGSRRRSARVLAAAAVVSGGMMVAARPNAADEALTPSPSEAPGRSTISQPAGQPAGESTTPADNNWPGKAVAPSEPSVDAGSPSGQMAEPRTASPSPSPLSVQRETSLLPLAQPLWTELTGEQQRTLEPFADEWNTWPVAEKRSWLALSDKLPSLDPVKREKMERRIAEWAKLTPEERRLARDAYRLAKERPSDTRVHEWERYRSMTQEQRSVLREAGTTSNTAAGHPGAPSGLAKEAAQPLPREPRKPWLGFKSSAPAEPNDSR